ncbi:hypothetical protein GQ43DRAFT_179609 [Delitschia confertaspora ATCC 74209]|uniref:Uncharacterized protein n=1 Tax=Delitschia confertaspora ATCC 74209 TaxID=1513339 RepID=A0A9P4MM91_9PLEO|nr:hypothetical protein GQ43DRAFT_179609 [Delitschia confertaspora ATCC 74209]
MSFHHMGRVLKLPYARVLYSWKEFSASALKHSFPFPLSSRTLALALALALALSTLPLVFSSPILPSKDHSYITEHKTLPQSSPFTVSSQVVFIKTKQNGMQSVMAQERYVGIERPSEIDDRTPKRFNQQEISAQEIDPMRVPRNFCFEAENGSNIPMQLPKWEMKPDIVVNP